MTDGRPDPRQAIIALFQRCNQVVPGKVFRGPQHISNTLSGIIDGLLYGRLDMFWFDLAERRQAIHG